METRAQTADFSWNPFVRIEGEAQAENLAKGGVWAAGLVGLSYVLPLGTLALSGGLFAEAAAVPAASAAVAVGLAAALAWRLQAKVSAVAAGLLLAWITVETAGGLWLAARGLDASRALGVAVDLFSLILAVQAWRGAWALRQARRPA